MASPGRLFLMLIAVPALAFVTAYLLLSQWETEWQQVLARQFPEAPAEQRAAATFGRTCGQPEFRSANAHGCSTQALVSVMRVGALATGGAGLGWLGLIALAGRLARRSRVLIVRVFRPGLYLTNLFLVLLIAAHAILAIATIFLGESALVGRVHIGIIAAIGLGALFGVWSMARVSFSLVRTASTRVIGRTVSREEHPALWNLAESVARSVAVTPPQHIVVGLEPNFFVTESPVQSLDGEQHGRTMFVSLPLCRIMTVDELRSVLGHELGHYKGGDTAFSTRFYPIYRGTSDGLEALQRSNPGGAGSIALIPGLAVLSFFLASFAVAEKRIGRERELAADLVGAETAGALVTATALVKVHAFAGHWLPVQKSLLASAFGGPAVPNASGLFVRLARDGAGPDALTGLDQRALSHPIDSHPPLQVRLDNLAVTLAAVQSAALDVAPPAAAITLIAEPDALEQTLTGAEREMLVAWHRHAVEAGRTVDGGPEPGMTVAPPETVPATVACWSCRGALTVTPDTRGKSVACPNCGTRQALPA